MSVASLPPNSSGRAPLVDHSGKAASEFVAASSPAAPKNEMALAVPAATTASRNGEMNASTSALNGTMAAPTRHHESSTNGMLNIGSMSTVAGYGSLSLAPQRRKRTDGGTTMTLYVRGKDSALSDANTVEASTLSKDINASAVDKNRSNGGGKDKAVSEVGESMPLVLAQTAISTVASSVGRASEGVSLFAKAVAKPAVTAAVVFVFFLLTDVYVLLRARATVQQLIDSRTAVNDQLLSVASGLMEQCMTKKAYAEALAEPYRRTPPADVERAVAEFQALADTKNRSVTTLWKHLAYPGPRSDIEFLVEQHVRYERHVQSLVESELDWVFVAQNALRARVAARQLTRIVIGDNADAYQEALADEIHRRMERIMYPLQGEGGERDERSDSEETSGAGRSRSGPGGREGDRHEPKQTSSADPSRCGKGYKGVPLATAAMSSLHGWKSSPAGTERTTASSSSGVKKRVNERGSGAFVEVTGGNRVARSSVRPRNKLEEVSVSAHFEAEEEEMAERPSVVERITGNRLAVFFVICALMCLYFRVS